MSLNNSVVIFLHGTEDSVALRPTLESVGLEAFGYRTFRQVADEHLMSICTPKARIGAFTPSLDEQVPAWFNCSSNYHKLGITDSFEDLDGVRASILDLRALIDDLGRTHKHIFVGGFATGGAISLYLSRELLPSSVIGLFSISSSSLFTFKCPKCPNNIHN